MEQRIHISNIDDSPVVCFDTGLDPRSFARTKMSQSLIEPGYVVNTDGTHEVWRSAGVNDINGSMRVYGPLFQGKRLDIIFDEASQTLGNKDKHSVSKSSMQAISSWIKAKMFLGETQSALNPGSSFVSPNGTVFFAPEYLSNRCLYIEGTQLDRYNCPDLMGLEASAFCAAVMLYQVITGVHPYPTSDIYQDMREGVFLPIHLAEPELDEKVAALIHAAMLLPVVKKRSPVIPQAKPKGLNILTDLLEILCSGKSLFKEMPKEKYVQAEKEKNLFLIKQNSAVKTRRFLTNNKYLIIGISLGIFFILFVLFSTTNGFAPRLTTVGMAPESVITAYYDAFSSLNYALMEACIQGADRSDINTAISLLAVYKQRQAYEMTLNPSLIQARAWKENGRELPAPDVFGVTDLTFEQIGGNELEGLVLFHTNYILWSPYEDFARYRSDRLMLRLDRRNHWRIIEIDRTER